jgi:hypothetical protein
MKVITLDNIEWVGDNTFFTPQETYSYYGKPRTIDAITIHWWNTPQAAGTMDETIAYLGRVEESIHFVVSGDRVVQMVNMNNTAFHAGSKGNPGTVGIEVDPRTPGNTYETVGALVKFIRELVKKDLPLKKHSEFVATTCPGTIDIGLIDRYARGQVNTPVTPPLVPVPVVRWRVKDLSGKQIGAYTVQINAWNKFLSVNRQARIFEGERDVTSNFIATYEPAPQPQPIPEKSETDKRQDQEITDVKTALESLKATVKHITDFLRSLFKNF